jgi:PD-(D/E)XK nuclease superfamily protein
MPQGQHIQHAKLRGEWAELRFQLRAAELGLILTRPCGDNAPYDFAVDHLGHFLRVQVKCTLQRREKNSYRCCLDHNGSPYTPTQIDLFAAYVIPADVWYILPLAATHSQPDILLTPHRQNSKYSRYKEAWHLLMQEL